METARIWLPARTFAPCAAARGRDEYKEMLAGGWDPKQPLLLQTDFGRCPSIEQANHRICAAVQYYPDMWVPVLQVFGATKGEMKALIHATNRPKEWYFPPSP